MTKQFIKYKCEICNEEYLSLLEAERCEGAGREIPCAKVGDSVSLKILGESEESSYWIDSVLYKTREYGHNVIYELGTVYDDTNQGEIKYYPLESIYDNETFGLFCKVIPRKM